MNNVIELSPYLPAYSIRRQSRCHALLAGISVAIESIVTILLGFGILAGLIIGLSIL